MLVHRYGPHIFHTNGERIFEYLSRYTEWRPYEHRVRSVVNGVAYPFPINRDTLNRLYGLDLDEAGAAAFLERAREPRDPVLTGEDVALNSVGRDLYEKFFLNYTRKQWGLDPSQLKAGVAARISVRTDSDDRYFTDTFQAMPRHGYTRMFEALLDHPNISVELGVDFVEMRGRERFADVVYTGPIDAYFGYRHGRLPYRSLCFEHEHLPGVGRFQETGTFNYPNDHAYTRITEFKHLTGQEHAGTSLVREYPQAEGDPYARREGGTVQALRSARREGAERDLRRPAGAVPLLQHGPGGGSRAHRRQAIDRLSFTCVPSRIRSGISIPGQLQSSAISLDCGSHVSVSGRPPCPPRFRPVNAPP